MDYGSLLSPLVALSGLKYTSNEAEFPKPSSYELDKITLANTAIPQSALHQKLVDRLQQISTPCVPWNPQNAFTARINFKFGSEMYLYPRSKPSPLSPRNKEASEPIFSPSWLRKYTLYNPTVACLFYQLPTSSEDEDLIEDLRNIRTKLSFYGIHLVVVIVGDLEDLRARVPYIRKQSSLAPRTGLLTLSESSNDTILDEFIDVLCDLFVNLSRDFFNAKQKRIRDKREQVAPPMDVMIWDARYTIKLAFCAEFKDDMASALKLLESAYDTISLLFKNRIFEINSAGYINARETLDAIAIRIFLHTLPKPIAFDKFIVHLSIVDENLEIYSLSKNSRRALKWRAFQYALFAHYCTEFKRYAPSDLTNLSTWVQPGGTSIGLLWLDSAKLLMSQPDDDTNCDDQYKFERIIEDVEINRSNEDPLMDVRTLFLKSISELSGFPRAKAYALSQYGAWLEKTNDSTASLQAFMSGNQTFQGNFWPDVQSVFNKKTNDQLALYVEGSLKEFPNQVQSAKIKLFNVTGLFKTPCTYVGREAKAQITLTPVFDGALELSWVRIVTSLGVILIESQNESGTTAKRFVDFSEESGKVASLEFSNRSPRTFQFGVTSFEIGEVELMEIQFQVKNSLFTQNMEVSAGDNIWITSNELTPKSVLHLKPNEASTTIQVNVRPAKIRVIDDLIDVAAADETIEFCFTLINEEDEDISPETFVKVRAEGINKNRTEGNVHVNAQDENEEENEIVCYYENMKHNSKKLMVGEKCTIRGKFQSPSKIFTVVALAKFETTDDSLPVMMEHTKEIDVLRPFRVSFDLLPEYHEQEWPAIFSPSVDLPKISRKWRLKPAILSMIKNSDLILHESSVTIECDHGDFNFEQETVIIEKQMQFNSLVSVSHSFVCQRSEENIKSSTPSNRPIEARAFLHLKWSRAGSPEIVNTFTLPAVRLNLPTHEPRVLVSSDLRGRDSEISQVTYHVENPTPRLLNFSITMSSSTYFAFQGHKAMSLRMLPFSTRSLVYQFIPLGNAAVQNRRPLPELRVYDVNYKRTLPIQSGDKYIIFEQGTLFI